uniref:Alpha-amylase n=1 Tax=Hirondellea gigas TaxID=1518452 RepID=A0A6A7GDD9_9CRUS
MRRLSSELLLFGFILPMLSAERSNSNSSSHFVGPVDESRSVFVHLFEWTFDDIAVECEQFLGPRGYSAVQVSPPQLSINGPQWWTRYQPVSYQLFTRSGNQQQFSSMVNRCNAVGVGIYVDAVINHMAAADRSFPDVPYGFNDFHNPQCFIDNYFDRDNVQRCDLLGLNDLNTEAEYVQQTISNYLNNLTSMGVAGFRIDAAKHIAASSLQQIVNRLVGNPFVFQEVISGGGEPITPQEYVQIGDVTEFGWGDRIKSAFQGGQLRNLQFAGNGLLASEQAVVFVDNHDTQREGRHLTYKDGSTYNLANIFQLSYPFGYPKVMSSYGFTDVDSGPPGTGVHSGNSCSDNGGDWICEHRWDGIANMVRFANVAVDAWTVDYWWDDGNNRIAFSRGNLAFIAINGENTPFTRTFKTGLNVGRYCEILFQSSNGAPCQFPVDVNIDGDVTLTIPAMNAQAIHVGSTS